MLEKSSTAHALTQIDLSSIVFFLGILLAVATLEHAKILAALAAWLDQTIGRTDVIVIALGLISAIVDNVPLVAASIGMYGIAQFPPDNSLGIHRLLRGHGRVDTNHRLGGRSCRNGSRENSIHLVHAEDCGLALVGYFAGAAIYILQYRLFH